MKRNAAFILLIAILLIFTSCSENLNPDVEGLSSDEVLTVYVWEMAEGSYRYGIMKGLPEEHSIEEKMKMGVAAGSSYNTEQVKEALSSYGYESDRILVIPYQHPLSSYIPKIWVYDENGKIMQTNDDYISKQRDLLGL